MTQYTKASTVQFVKEMDIPSWGPDRGERQARYYAYYLNILSAYTRNQQSVAFVTPLSPDQQRYEEWKRDAMTNLMGPIKGIDGKQLNRSYSKEGIEGIQSNRSYSKQESKRKKFKRWLKRHFVCGGSSNEQSTRF